MSGQQPVCCVFTLTIMVSGATPEDERNFGVEDGG
jgi:hypothetical protein